MTLDLGLLIVAVMVGTVAACYLAVLLKREAVATCQSMLYDVDMERQELARSAHCTREWR